MTRMAIRAQDRSRACIWLIVGALVIRPPSAAMLRPRAGERSRLLASGSSLLDIGDDVIDIVILGQAREDHLGAGNLGAGIFQIFLQGRFIPGDARILVGVAVGIVGIASGLAA